MEIKEGQQQSNIDSTLSKLREAVSGNVKERVAGLSRSFETSILNYMLRPNSDPKVIDLLSEVVGRLDHSLSLGRSDEGLPTQKLADVKAGLYGASRILDPAMDTMVPPVEPVANAALAGRFLELVSKRVGEINKNTGEAEIKMKLSREQTKSIIKYTYKKTT